MRLVKILPSLEAVEPIRVEMNVAFQFLGIQPYRITDFQTHNLGCLNLVIGKSIALILR